VTCPQLTAPETEPPCQFRNRKRAQASSSPWISKRRPVAPTSPPKSPDSCPIYTVQRTPTPPLAHFGLGGSALPVNALTLAAARDSPSPNPATATKLSNCIRPRFVTDLANFGWRETSPLPSHGRSTCHIGPLRLLRPPASRFHPPSTDPTVQYLRLASLWYRIIIIMTVQRFKLQQFIL
jgi:hypothetical protein